MSGPSDNVKLAVAGAVRNLLMGKTELVSWRYEVLSIIDLQTQVKVWPAEGQPPRYFIVQIKEGM